MGLPEPVPAQGPEDGGLTPVGTATTDFDDVSEDDEDEEEDAIDECYLRLMALKTLPEAKEDQGQEDSKAGSNSFFGDMVDLIGELPLP